LKKIAALFMTFIFFATISGSFATAPCSDKNKCDTEYGLYSLSITPNELNSNWGNHAFLSIVLPTLQTAGYKWIAEYDFYKVKLIKIIYIPNPTKIGSNGYNYYLFYGEKGSKIHMILKRPWESRIIREVTYYIE
jgi:hypothetical protein